MIRTEIVYGNCADIGEYALAHCVNALAAEGADHFAAEAVFQIPEDEEKSRLYELKKRWKKMAEHLPFFSEIKEAEGRKCPAVLLAAAAVAAEGKNAGGKELPREKIKDFDIIMTGWAGLEGMQRILDEKEEVLAGRFSPSFLRLIRSSRMEIFAVDTARAARDAGILLIRHVGEGGVFKALWDLAREAGCGLEADLKRIPVRQETIEVSELFHINPYQLTSSGCFLMAAADGEEAAEKLRQQGIDARVIGKMRKDNGKILRNGEEIRFIDRPAPDEIWKIWENK